jgi:hypothetical protein
MSALKRGFIILVAVLFLGVVTTGGGEAAPNTTKGSKSSADNRSISDAQTPVPIQTPTPSPSSKGTMKIKRGTSSEAGIAVSDQDAPE